MVSKLKTYLIILVHSPYKTYMGAINICSLVHCDIWCGMRKKKQKKQKHCQPNNRFLNKI